MTQVTCINLLHKQNHMRRYLKYIQASFIGATLMFTTQIGSAQDTNFEFDFNPITGEGANLGGILFPVVFTTGTFGAFESGANAANYANSGHDPQRDVGFQTIETTIFLKADRLTGRFTGFGQQGANDWEAELEEAYLRYRINDAISIGGGQFLNFFGFQSHRHLHGWDYVNNNLTNSRMVGEGELVTQGGHLVLKNPNSDRFNMLTIGVGGARAHAHEHGEEEEHHDDDDDHDEDEEEHHLEADGANFNDWVATADLKWALNDDGSTLGTASVGVGENGFGETTFIYGFGVQKVWGGRDSGFGYQGLAPGAFMIRSEFVGRSFDAVEFHEDEGEYESAEFDDHGLSTSVFYGLNENANISFRHDYVSGIEELELEDYHRFSPALTTRFGPNKRFQARLQYDFNDREGLEEHVGWLQFQYQWGSTVGGYWRD